MNAQKTSGNGLILLIYQKFVYLCSLNWITKTVILNGLHKKYSDQTRPIYGSSRLGIMNKEVVFNMTGDLMSKFNSPFGIKEYKLSDHLDNVSAVILDRKYCSDAEYSDEKIL